MNRMRRVEIQRKDASQPIRAQIPLDIGARQAALHEAPAQSITARIARLRGRLPPAM